MQRIRSDSKSRTAFQLFPFITIKKIKSYWVWFPTWSSLRIRKTCVKWTSRHSNSTFIRNSGTQTSSSKNFWIKRWLFSMVKWFKTTTTLYNSKPFKSVLSLRRNGFNLFFFFILECFISRISKFDCYVYALLIRTIRERNYISNKFVKTW
mgnify:CR=1 FL=1